MLPRWYGLAYHEWSRDEQVAYPIPLNLIVRWWRDLVWLVKRGKRSVLDEARQAAYEKGRAAGWEQGRRAGRAQLRAELEDAFELTYGRKLPALREGTGK
jgi:hypothetical protein